MLDNIPTTTLLLILAAVACGLWVLHYITQAIFTGRHNRLMERRGPGSHWQFDPEIVIGKVADFTFREGYEPERTQPDVKFTGRPVWYSLHISGYSDRYAIGDILFELIEDGAVSGYIHARRKKAEFQALEIHGPIPADGIVDHLMKSSYDPRTFIERLGLEFPIKRLTASVTDENATIQPAPAAIDWALRNADGLEFLQHWKAGHEARIRELWPQVPDEVFSAPQFRKLQLATADAGGQSN